MIEVHASNNNFVVSNTDLQFFQDGYLLINEIRKILGLAPTKYLIGILDMTSDDYKADTIEVTEGIFIRSMRSRGSEKTGLARSDEVVGNYNPNDLSCENCKLNYFDKTFKEIIAESKEIVNGENKKKNIIQE